MQKPTVSPTPAYPSPIDAIVLAGTDDNPRRMIQGENKAFLKMGGETLILRVVRALQDASSIGQIFVVGPTQRLSAALGTIPPEVTIVEQAGKMLANAWEAIHASEARYRERTGSDDDHRPMLFISSDLPLVSEAAVDDFVLRCARRDARGEGAYSMLAGVAEEASLRQFYPTEATTGIKRPYVHLSDCRLRLANIYVGRPRTLSHQGFLQTGFEHRKAEKWKNVMGLAWNFLGQAGGVQAALLTARLQATLLASGGQGWWYRTLRAGNTRQRLEQACGTVLGGRVGMIITPYGGLSLDVDNAEDYRVLKLRYDDWRQAAPVEPVA
jgi:GTP:adenosylcobinamide-phosphate guanylyltransferase